MRSLEFHAMGSRMLVAVDTSAAAEHLDRVPEWFRTWEACLTRFQADSELSALNQAAGEPFAVSDVLWDALQAALEASRFSGGLVTPTMAPWLEAAGYDRSFEAILDLGTASATVLAPPVRARTEILLDAKHRRVTLAEGCRLDLGGTAKGWAADRARHRLQSMGPCLVDAGGDVAVQGPHADGRGWPVGIGDPFRPGESIDLLCLTHGGVATSGRDYRRWQREGAWQHHILDPRTGLPASTDVLTATVVARNTVEAEAAAKVAVILGSEAALDWLDNRPSLAGLLVLEDGSVRRSRRLARFLWR
jgi:thiamine biosynthesis lipoprotein